MNREEFEEIERQAAEVAKFYKIEQIDDFTMSATHIDGEVTFVHFDDPIENFESLGRLVVLNIAIDKSK